MQKALRSINYSFHSPHNPPQFTVRPGETFIAETELCSGDWLRGPSDTWSPEKANALNPAVCVAVEGAKPGDVLAVEILDIVPDSVGYTGFGRYTNPLARSILTELPELNTRTLNITNGFVLWSDSLKLPIAPMIGTLGTAPKTETLSNAKGGGHGGNMDAQEVCVGSTVFLPVEVEGALLHIGDVHAIQGDGEINCAGGVECRAEVTLRASVVKRPIGFGCVRVENEEFITTIACCRTAEESFIKATAQLVNWISQDYGMDSCAAYLLLGQVMQARATQFVNPTSTYVCKIAKKYLSTC